MEKFAIWTYKRIDHQTLRYALRAGRQGTGRELGAYSSWENARAEEACEPIIARIEREAYAAGYKVYSHFLGKFLTLEEAGRA